MTDAPTTFDPTGALLALPLLVAGLLAGWRATRALAAGPAMLRALTACGIATVPPLLGILAWAMDRTPYAARHAVVTAGLSVVVPGLVLAFALMARPRPMVAP